MAEETKELRRRGTAVLLRDGLVLLVRDRGARRYSLPGGAARRKEPSLAAAVRELSEEVGLRALRAERVPAADFRGRRCHHRVTVVAAPGEPKVQSAEIVEVRWWDLEEDLPRFRHVDAILAVVTGQQLVATRRRQK